MDHGPRDKSELDRGTLVTLAWTLTHSVSLSEAGLTQPYSTRWELTILLFPGALEAQLIVICSRSQDQGCQGEALSPLT